MHANFATLFVLVIAIVAFSAQAAPIALGTEPVLDSRKLIGSGESGHLNTFEERRLGEHLADRGWGGSSTHPLPEKPIPGDSQRRRGEEENLAERGWGGSGSKPYPIKPIPDDSPVFGRGEEENLADRGWSGPGDSHRKIKPQRRGEEEDLNERGFIRA